MMQRPAFRPFLVPLLAAVSLALAPAARAEQDVQAAPPAAVTAAPAAPAAAPALPAATPGVEDALKRGQALLDKRQFVEAAKELERADQLAGGRSAAVDVALAQAYDGVGVRPKAIAAARAAIALDPLPALLADADNQLSHALLLGHASDAELAEAEALSRKAIALVDSGMNHLRLAAVLMRRNDTPAAVAEARRSLAVEPGGPAAKAARVFVCQHRTAPPDAAGAQTASAPGQAGEPRDPAGPEAIYRVNPVYPADQAWKWAHGDVQVQVAIDAEGCVTDAKVVKGEETGFGKAAVDAARQFVFSPARAVGGKPVATDDTLTFTFKIENPKHW